MSKCDGCRIKELYVEAFNKRLLGDEDCSMYCPKDMEFDKTYTSSTYTFEQKGEVGMPKVNVHYPIADKEKTDG